MFGIFKRHKERMAEIERKHEHVMQGYRRLDLARELLRQSARGELPLVEIVEIGEGFYVERRPDGSRNTVVLDKSKIPAARLDAHIARAESTNTVGYKWPSLEQTEAYKAKLDAYTARVQASARELDERAKLWAEQALAAGTKFDTPTIETPEAPQIDPPSITAPLNPKP